MGCGQSASSISDEPFDEDSTKGNDKTNVQVTKQKKADKPTKKKSSNPTKKKKPTKKKSSKKNSRAAVKSRKKACSKKRSSGKKKILKLCGKSYKEETTANLIGPSILKADEMTCVYNVPTQQFPTLNDVAKYNGFAIGKKIGAGGFGTVFLASTKTGRLFACKTIPLDMPDDAVDAKNELWHMERIQNRFAVRLYLHFIVNRNIYFLMYFANGGNLVKWYEKNFPPVFDEASAKKLFAQMVLSVEVMHQHKTVHFDFKPENYLVVDRKEPVLLLSDFGMSRLVRLADNGTEKMFSSQAGTKGYIAPEQISIDGVPFKDYQGYPVDVWALGCTLYYVLCEPNTSL